MQNNGMFCAQFTYNLISSPKLLGDWHPHTHTLTDSLAFLAAAANLHSSFELQFVLGTEWHPHVRSCGGSSKLGSSDELRSQHKFLHPVQNPKHNCEESCLVIFWNENQSSLNMSSVLLRFLFFMLTRVSSQVVNNGRFYKMTIEDKLLVLNLKISTVG